jgi:hypothetical protein
VEHSWQSPDLPASGAAQTTWEFSATSPDDPAADDVKPPMIRPTYDAAVAPDGSTPAWRPLWFDLKFDYADGTAVQAKAAKLWLSPDRGKHWTPAPLVPAQDGYRTLVPPTMLVRGKSLSIRTTATDKSGNSVTQTVLDLVPVH